MKNIIGTVEKIENGSFNLRTSNGKIIPLHEGHKIYNGESILGKDENSLIGIKLSNKEIITLTGKTEQLFDNSLLNKIDNEELAFNQKVVKDITSIETASGEDKTNVETATGNENQDSTSFKAVFDARDGNSVDIESDLREGTLNQDVNYYQYEQLDASLLNPQAELEPVTPLPVEPTPPPVPPVKPEEPEIPLNATLNAKDNTVIEGENITITVTLDNPSKNDLIITLSNDEIITIKAGETEGGVTFKNPYMDDKYVQGDRNIDFSIKNVTGDNIENLPTVTITVKDDNDITKITLTGSSVNEGEEHTITATVDNAPKTDLTITLSNGKTITILAGETTNSVTYNSRADDVYLQGEESTPISITSTTGGDYENLDTSSTTTVNTTDDSDITTVTVTSSTNVTYNINDIAADLTTDNTGLSISGKSGIKTYTIYQPNEQTSAGNYNYKPTGKVPEDVLIKEVYVKDGIMQEDETGVFAEVVIVLENPAPVDLTFRYAYENSYFTIKAGETTAIARDYLDNTYGGENDVYKSGSNGTFIIELTGVDGKNISLREDGVARDKKVVYGSITLGDDSVDTTQVNIKSEIADDNVIFTVQTSNPVYPSDSTNVINGVTLNDPTATVEVNGVQYIVALDRDGKGILSLSLENVNIQTGEIHAEVTNVNARFEDLTYGSTSIEVHKEVTYDIQTSNPPDPNGNWDYINTFPTATVEVNHNGKVENYTVNLDKEGKGTLTLDTTDCIGKEEPTIKVIEVDGNYENVDLEETTITENPTTYTDVAPQSVEVSPMSVDISSNPLSNDIDLTHLTDDVIKDGVMDLKNESFDKLMITLEDVMNLNEGKQITITGADIDKLTFKDTVASDGTVNHWENSVCEINHDTGMNECIYTNSGDDHLQIKVEQPISDGVTC